MAMMRGVDRFVNRRDVIQTGKTAQNDEAQILDNAVKERHRLAQELRVPVPVTRLEAKPDGNVSSLPALAAVVAARYPLSPDLKKIIAVPTNKFDETELEESTISSVDAVQYENLIANEPRFEQPYAEKERDYAEDAHPVVEDGEYIADDVYRPRSLSEEIAEARRQYPENARYFQAQSPSIRNFVRNATNNPRPVSPVARSVPRPRTSHKSTIPPPSDLVNASDAVAANPPAKKAISFENSCSYTKVAAEVSPLSTESPITETRKKRSGPELLDYDSPTLKTMLYEELDSQPFDVDPRLPPHGATSTKSSSSSTTESHQQKLSTLKSLSEAERSRFFSSQPKDQWSNSMTFFGKRLEALLSELEDARSHRRDVAARFEDEVRERMGEVKGNAEGIDRCLTEMRGKARGVLPSGNGNDGRVGSDQGL